MSHNFRLMNLIVYTINIIAITVIIVFFLLLLLLLIHSGIIALADFIGCDAKILWAAAVGDDFIFLNDIVRIAHRQLQTVFRLCTYKYFVYLVSPRSLTKILLLTLRVVYTVQPVKSNIIPLTNYKLPVHVQQSLALFFSCFFCCFWCLLLSNKREKKETKHALLNERIFNFSLPLYMETQ